MTMIGGISARAKTDAAVPAAPGPDATDAADAAEAAPIFIGGAPRSGTTLLRAIIDAHPAIACGPELRAVPAFCSLLSNIRAVSGEALEAGYSADGPAIDAAFAEAILAMIAGRRRAAGKPRIAEKTPANVLHFKTLRRLFPQAPLIAIHRDPRDVVASLLSMDWRDANGAPLRITTDAAAAAELWATSIDAQCRMSGDGLFFAIRYEDLVADPAKVSGALFDFLRAPHTGDRLDHSKLFNATSGENESSNARVAQPVDRRSVGRWKTQLPTASVAVVEKIAGGRMATLGYA